MDFFNKFLHRSGGGNSPKGVQSPPLPSKASEALDNSRESNNKDGCGVVLNQQDGQNADIKTAESCSLSVRSGEFTNLLEDEDEEEEEHFEDAKENKLSLTVLAEDLESMHLTTPGKSVEISSHEFAFFKKGSFDIICDPDETANFSLDENDLSREVTNHKTTPNKSHLNSFTQVSTNSFEDLEALECKPETPSKSLGSIQNKLEVSTQISSRSPDSSLEVNILHCEQNLTLSTPSSTEPEYLQREVDISPESDTKSSKENLQPTQTKEILAGDSSEVKDIPPSPKITSSSQCISLKKCDLPSEKESNSSTSDSLCVVNGVQSFSDESFVNSKNDVRGEEGEQITRNKSMSNENAVVVNEREQSLTPHPSTIKPDDNFSDIPNVDNEKSHPNELSCSMNTHSTEKEDNKTTPVKNPVEIKEVGQSLKVLSPNHNSLLLENLQSTSNTSHSVILDTLRVEDTQKYPNASPSSIENNLVEKDIPLALNKSMTIENSSEGRDQNTVKTTPALNESYSSRSSIPESDDLQSLPLETPPLKHYFEGDEHRPTQNKFNQIGNTLDAKDTGQSLKPPPCPNDNNSNLEGLGLSLNNESNANFSVSSYAGDAQLYSDGSKSSNVLKKDNQTILLKVTQILSPQVDEEQNSVNYSPIQTDKEDVQPTTDKFIYNDSNLHLNDEQLLINSSSSPKLNNVLVDRLMTPNMSPASLLSEEESRACKLSDCSKNIGYDSSFYPKESMLIGSNSTDNVVQSLTISPLPNENSFVVDNQLLPQKKSNLYDPSIADIPKIEEAFQNEPSICIQNPLKEQDLLSNSNTSYTENDNLRKSNASIQEIFETEGIQQVVTETIPEQNLISKGSSPMVQAHVNIATPNILEGPQQSPNKLRSSPSKIGELKESSPGNDLQNNSDKFVQGASVDTVHDNVAIDDHPPSSNESVIEGNLAPVTHTLQESFETCKYKKNDSKHKYEPSALNSAPSSIQETFETEGIQQVVTKTIPEQNLISKGSSPMVQAHVNIASPNKLYSSPSKNAELKESSPGDDFQINSDKFVQDASVDTDQGNVAIDDHALSSNQSVIEGNLAPVTHTLQESFETCKDKKNDSKHKCEPSALNSAPIASNLSCNSTIQQSKDISSSSSTTESHLLSKIESEMIPKKSSYYNEVNVVDEKLITSLNRLKIPDTPSVTSDVSNKNSTLRTDLTEDTHLNLHEKYANCEIVDSIEFDQRIADEAANISDDICNQSQELESDLDDLPVLSAPDKINSTTITDTSNISPVFKKPSNVKPLIKKTSPTKPCVLRGEIRSEDIKPENHNEFSEHRAQSMRPVLAASHLNQSEAGPITADELTTDTFQDGATLDLDYFTSVGGTGSFKESLTRDSLYVKFDPIVGAIVSASVNERFMMPPPSSQDEKEPNLTSEDEKPVNEEGTDAAAGDSCANNHTPVCSPALKVVQKLISLTPAATPVQATPNSTPVKADRSPAVASPSPKSAVVPPEMQNMLKKLEAELQDREKDYNNMLSMNKKLEVDLKSSLEREYSLKKDVHEKTKSKQQLSLVIEEYEKTISQLVAQKEEEKKGFEVQKLQLIQERDTATQHLNNMEIAFNDIHQKYERGKSIIEGMKVNEDRLKESLAEYDEAIKSYNAKYEHLKTHAIRQLETANQELDMIRRNQQAEVAKLKAMLKKAEVKATSMEESLEQKTKENQELASICDELINKVGSN